MSRLLLFLALAAGIAACSPAGPSAQSITPLDTQAATASPSPLPALTAMPALVPSAVPSAIVAPTATAAGATAEAIVKGLLAAEQAGDLDKVLRAYDEHAAHILLDATASKRSADFTSYHTSPSQLRAYWAALLQDHFGVEVVDVLVTANVPPAFSAGLGGSAEQVTVRSRQTLDSQRQAGIQFAQVLDNYLIVSGKIVSQATLVAHNIPSAPATAASDASFAGIYAATRNQGPVAFGFGFLVFAEHNRYYATGAGNGFLDTGTFQIRGDQLLLTSNDPDCQKAGRSPDFTYQWVLDKQLLNLSTVVDHCASGHSQLFAAGPWTKKW